MRITNKHAMYAKLAAGEFGNTCPMWFGYQSWLRDMGRLRPDDPLARCLWGVRSLTPGGVFEPHVPAGDVRDACTARNGAGVNISPMIDTLPGLTVTAMLNVWESPTGLVVEAVTDPPAGANWRQVMPSARTHTTTTARLLLDRHLNANSRDDLRVLLDAYPGHVVELSAMNICWGTVPHRDAVCWEVRAY
jgi:hypothetical protein